MDKANFPKWLDRYPVLDQDHIVGLDQLAAINEFAKKLPRHKAEEEAYEQYKHEQLVDAGAHHLAGMRAALAVDDHEEAEKHGALYTLVCKALNENPVDEPPAEIASKAKNTPAKVYKFKAHKGDAFALPKIQHKEEDKSSSSDSQSSDKKSP
jgi:hypothetical protein